MSRTRLAPTPTNISTKSEPEIVKKGTLASPATARAVKVLPVPGGPTNSAPLGILPPKRWNFEGSFKKSTTSCNSSRASSMPATSSKVTLFLFSVSSFALDLPKPIAPPLPPPPDIWRIKKNHRPTMISKGNKFAISAVKKLARGTSSKRISALAFSKRAKRSVAGVGTTATKDLSSCRRPRAWGPMMVTSFTRPLSTSVNRVE